VEAALLKLVGESMPGDPESPLLWTTKSLDHLARTLTDHDSSVRWMTVSQWLAKNPYRMQAHRQRFEPSRQHPDREGQCVHRAKMTQQFQGLGDLVMSLDAKKKERMGPFKNNGCEYLGVKARRDVNGHDFMDKDWGKAVRYGVYEPTDQSGWINMGPIMNSPNSRWRASRIASAGRRAGDRRRFCLLRDSL
jgi:hypothetical protein